GLLSHAQSRPAKPAVQPNTPSIHNDATITATAGGFQRPSKDPELAGEDGETQEQRSPGRNDRGPVARCVPPNAPRGRDLAPAASRWDHFLMDEDDPEQRIAELERQLAERRGAGGPAGLTTGGCLTPEQVHNMAFSKPPIGKRGYNEDEVDA